MASGFFHIVVESLPKLDATTTSADCAPVTFSTPSGSKFEVWTFVPATGPMPPGLGRFRNAGNGGFITAHGGTIGVGCSNPGPKDQTLWRVTSNGDGTYLVAVPDAPLIWSVNAQNRLVFTGTQKPITDSEKFAFPRA